MKIDIIGDEPDPEARLLLKEIRKRGYEGEFIDPENISYMFDKHISILYKGRPYNVPEKAIARSGFTRGIQSSGRVFILSLEALGCRIVDSPQTVLSRQEKTITTAILTANDIPVPKTLYLADKMSAKNIDFFPIVVKPVGGRRGKGIYKVNKPSGIRSYPSYVQEFIDHPGRDFRIFCVGKKTLGAICRQAKKKGEWRSNVALGAQAKEVKLTAKMKNLAQKSRKVLGLEICGIDLLENGDDYVVLEANRAPQFRGFMKGTGIDVPKEIIDYVVRS